MRVIAQELDEEEDTRFEADRYRQQMEALNLPQEAVEKLDKEIDRLSRMPGNSQEAAVIRTYLDTCLGLPWGQYTVDDLDIRRAENILNKEHYGLKKVKDRILEILAVRKLNPELKGQIICLVGPPGVGKTSIARSIATWHRAQIRPDEPGRRTGRSGDSWPQKNLHRGNARQDHQRHQYSQKHESAAVAG